MKKKTVFLLIFFVAFLKGASAQEWINERSQLIFGLGGTGFLGDLGGGSSTGRQDFRDLNFSATRPAVKLGYRYHFFDELAVKGNLIYGRIFASDEFSDEPFRNNRNIHFRSPILETSVQGEYYFFSFGQLGARFPGTGGPAGWRTIRFRAYLFGGIGGFYFNPQGQFNAANYNGSIPAEELPSDGWYDLRELSTEGQGFFPTREKYSRIQLTIPMGVGFTYRLTRELNLGLEFGYRKTFTDYIDDVSTTYVDPAIYSIMFEGDNQKIALAEYFSNPTNNNLPANVTSPGMQRGSPSNDDAYMFLMITINYKIIGGGPPWAPFIR